MDIGDVLPAESGEREGQVGGPASLGEGRCLPARLHRGQRNLGGSRYRAGGQGFCSKCSTKNFRMNENS